MDEASVLSSFSASSSTVLNKVNERKRAEAEVALLANRLQHLRNEHARTRHGRESREISDVAMCTQGTGTRHFELRKVKGHDNIVSGITGNAPTRAGRVSSHCNPDPRRKDNSERGRDDAERAR